MNIKCIDSAMKHSKRIFFVGIGGISMSSIALILKSRGYEVGGSDRSASALTDKLIDNGIEVFFGHDAKNPRGYDFLVYTAAVDSSNPEIKAACEMGIPCVSRGDFLGWLMTSYRERIGVCGTHGKSTTTGMISQIMLDTEADPTIVCGAEFSKINGAYRVGGDDTFVFEACEYKDSFLSFSPTVSVVTNIDLDHPDYFKSLEQLRTSFVKYMNYSDIAVVNFDSKDVRIASESFTGKRLITYGIESGDVNFYAKNINFVRGKAEFDIYHDGVPQAHINLKVPGTHNIYNALAAASAANACGVPFSVIQKSLSEFGGIKRRFEYKGSFGNVSVYDDYSHHPTEIKATLDGAKRLGYNRIFCVFQPHTYSRTKELFDDFKNSFNDADVVIFADIYAAREVNTFNISSKMLADAVPHALYFDSFDKIAQYVRDNATSHDMVITVGAGDVYKVGELLLR